MASEEKKSQGNRPTELTRDDAARIAASAINDVFEKLQIGQMVDGISVLPGGEGVFLVDILMLDTETQQNWSIFITVPPPKAASEHRE